MNSNEKYIEENIDDNSDENIDDNSDENIDENIDENSDENSDENQSDLVEKIDAFYGWILLIMAIILPFYGGIKSCDKEKTTTSVETTADSTIVTVSDAKDGSYITHIVKPGESWASIVETYGLDKIDFTYADLAAYNNKTDTTPIHKDDIIYVPILG